MKEKNQDWWNEHGGFFGAQYLLGDDSLEGYVPGKPESLEERTKREVDGIIRLLNPRPHAWILDVPCGYGRHVIELRKRGYSASGIDINEELLNIARGKAKEFFGSKPAWEQPHFEKRDMRTLEYYCEYIGTSKWRNHFDCLINMFYSFGFFSDEDNIATMQSFYDALSKNRKGKMLIHTDISPEMILQGKSYRLSERRNLKNGGQLQIEEGYDPSSKRINGTWTLFDKQGNANKLTPYSVRIYSAQEFTDMAKHCGFKEIKIYGSFMGESFNLDSKEMIVVAKK